MLSNLVALMRQITDHERVAAPWMEWGRKHLVWLHYSPYVAVDAAYVVKCGPPPRTEYEYMVFTSEIFMVKALKVLGEGCVFPLRDRDVATMMAWLKAEDLSDKADA